MGQVVVPEFRWARADLNEKARRSALAVLSPAERGRYDDTSPARRDAFLAGRMVLRGLAGQLTGTAPAELDLEAVCPDCGGPHGRPVLRESALQLSLSHGAGVVVAAAVWDAQLGIDIEAPEVEPARLEAIAELTGRASVAHWSSVEAVLKADGRGLRVDPARVTVEGRQGWVDDDVRRYDLSEVDLAPGVRVTVAVAAVA